MQNFIKITYLYQSGFKIELDNYLLVIDYYKGDLELESDKDVIFIVTHGHSDHYNPEIFTMKGSEKAKYILSSDIENPAYGQEDEDGKILKLSSSNMETERMKIVYDPKRSLRLSPGQSFSFAGLSGQAFGSTDQGISIYFKLGPLALFHAGDLNAWKWPSFTIEDQKKEVEDYLKIIKEISDKPIDIAFGPVDPRLGKNAFLGAEYLLNYLKPQMFFPMHFQDNIEICNEFVNRARDISPAYVANISYFGQNFVIQI